MNWEAAGAIGEIVGAAAVVVSLVYLASQIRTQNREARAASVHQVMHEYSNAISRLHEAYFRWRECRLEEDARRSLLTPLIDVKSTEGFKRYWELRRHQVRPEFADYIDALEDGKYSF